MTFTITPLDLQRPIGHVTLNGKRLDVYPSHDFARAFNALLARTGGATSDLIAAVSVVAQQAASAAASAPLAAVQAYDAGAPSGYALNPAAPLSTQIDTRQLATVLVAAHTRTPTGMALISLNAGSVQINRDEAVTIYYVDPTDAGGAVTYLATTDPAVAGDYGAGARIVGSAYVAPETTPLGGGGGETP